MKVKVECHSGYKANERPVRFYLNEIKLEVKIITDRWYGEDYEYFKFVADDNNTYILKYCRSEDAWRLKSYSIPEQQSKIKANIINLNRARKSRRKLPGKY